MRFSWENKVCWIVGASSGIGQAVALLLAEKGARVYVSARRKAELEALSKTSPRIVSLPLDVLEEKAIEQTLHHIRVQEKKLDLLFVCSGIYEPGPLEETSPDSVERVLRVNLLAACHLLMHSVPIFFSQGFGHMAGVASVVGYRALPHSLAYGASKAGLIHFLESMRFECEPKGIHVSVVNPGFVKSQLTDKNTFPMPFLIDEETAARYIVQGLERNKREIVFPWQMKILAKIFQILPFRLYSFLMKKGLARA